MESCVLWPDPGVPFGPSGGAFCERAGYGTNHKQISEDGGSPEIVGRFCHFLENAKSFYNVRSGVWRQLGGSLSLKVKVGVMGGIFLSLSSCNMACGVEYASFTHPTSP